MSRGFVVIPNEIVRDGSLSPHARILYGLILSYAWGERGCTASTERLCREAGMGRTTFFESIRALRDRGLIRVEKRVSKHGWRNVYFPVVRLGGVASEEHDGEPPEGDEDLTLETGDAPAEPERASGGRPVVREANGGSSATRTQKKTKEEEDGFDQGSKQGRARASRARAAADRLPLDFPQELVPHARAVYRVLRQVAEEHGAAEVKPLALGRVMMARPRKPFVRAAHDFAAWAADARRPIRDVVASYRNWIDRERDLQAIERLPDAPSSSPAGTQSDNSRYMRED